MRSLRVSLTIGLLLSPQAALACGGMVSESGGAELTGFEALLRWEGDREELVVSIGYMSGDSEFGWLMPLPSPPKVAEAKGDLITKAFQITEPPQLEEESEDEEAAAPPAVGAGPGVDVIGRDTVGALRFVTLGGTNAGEVTRWMRKHGFAFHDRQQPVLQDYLERGWVVVAARPAPGPEYVTETSLVPVRFRFRTAEPVYPLAMAGAGHEEQDLEVALFVLSPFRPTATTFEERIVRPRASGDFPSPGGQLELRYSAPLGERAGRMQATPDTWLTRYEATLKTTDLTADLVFARSPDQSAIDYADLGDGQGGSWILWTAIAIMLVVLAIWISLGMARRRRAEEAPRMPTQIPPAP